MRLAPYVEIARPDHWFKNIFMLPGMALACFFDPGVCAPGLWLSALLGVVSTCLTASSNYTLNEILDAPRDRHHPWKRFRPVPSGMVSIPAAYLEWALLAAAGIGLGFAVGTWFGILSLSLWVMGLLYNVPPARLKELPYADVLSESLNNPIRMGLGWYMTGACAVPPVSAAFAYWMFGAFLMAMKRFAEYRQIGDPEQAALYRRSFRYYNEARLIESMFFYAAFFGMLSGFFMARYHIDLILAAPFVACAMAYYMHLGFKPDSPVQTPEKLYTQRKLMLLVALACAVCAFFLFNDVPLLAEWLAPTPIVR